MLQRMRYIFKLLARAIIPLAHLVIQMDFSNEEDHRKYQQDAIHQAFKEAAGPYLGAPPATHDFWKQ